MQTGLPPGSLNAAFTWPVPLQILSLPHKAYNAPVLEAQALHLLNRQHFVGVPQDLEMKQPGENSTHTFGSLEGLRHTGEPKTSALDERLIAPYLLRDGYEGMSVEVSRRMHNQHGLAENTITS